MNMGFLPFFRGKKLRIFHRAQSRFGPMFTRVVTVSPPGIKEGQMTTQKSRKVEARSIPFDFKAGWAQAPRMLPRHRSACNGTISRLFHQGGRRLACLFL